MNGRDAAGAGILMLALLLAGCAGQMIHESMQPMIGRPATHAFAKLGFPDSEDTVAGRKFYVWTTESSGSHLVPQFNTGTIRGKDGTTTFSYTTFEEQFYHHECRLRVFVDAKDRIAAYDLNGNDAGCSVFARKLSR